MVLRSDGWCILRIIFVITSSSYSFLLRGFFTGYDSIYPSGKDFFLFSIENATHISPSGICSGKLVSRLFVQQLMIQNFRELWQRDKKICILSLSIQQFNVSWLNYSYQILLYYIKYEAIKPAMIMMDKLVIHLLGAACLLWLSNQSFK